MHSRLKLPSLYIEIGFMLLVAGLILFALFTAIGISNSQDRPRTIAIPDTLRVVTTSGSTTYFEYKGEQMGYEYELLNLLADSLGIPFKLSVVSGTATALRAIDSGDADLCITPQAVTVSGKKKYLYVGHEKRGGLVLIQRNVPKDSLITKTTELIGKRITVPANTRYADRLRHLDAELGSGIDISIVSGDTVTTEDLIAYVAEGLINYTVTDENLARISRTYYRNLDIGTDVGFPQRLAWIVRKDHEQLARLINERMRLIPQGEAYHSIYKRYFEQSKNEEEEVVKIPDKNPGNKTIRKVVYRRNPGDLSPFDELFKKEAEVLGWPWQLLAAIAFHESRFRADIVGWSGARGLMGIMPATGRRFGKSRDELLDPAVSVKVSVRVLLATKKALGDIPDPTEQIKLTLAGYNAGYGHIQDAMRLAVKHGANPKIWDKNVQTYVRLKSEPAYYNDPVCRAGYLRGRETVRYVTQVMDWYRRHK